jgi:hypothetical protein
MPVSLQSVDDIRSSFPHPSISNINGEPNREEITRIHRLLKGNCASVPSTLGGGNHGLLGLAINPNTYQQVVGVAFVLPNNPGATPNIPANATQAQIGVATRLFDQQYKTYHETMRTDQAMKQQLLGCVEPIYVETLRNPHTGFTMVSTLQLLDHLYNNYGQISNVDLDENERKLKTKYDANLPIDTLFRQIETAAEFADAGGSPFTNRQIVNAALLLVFQTGAYADECKLWKRRPIIQQTWIEFKQEFARAYRERRELHNLQQQGTAGNHFGAANHTEEIVDTNEDYQNETRDALTAIANATVENGTNVANLARDNASLRQQLREMQSLLASMQTTLVGYSRQSLPPGTPANPPGRRDNQQQRTTSPPPNRQRRRDRGYDPTSQHYCWSHGLTRSSNHTSANCRTPEEGHKRNATFENRMGGSSFKCSNVT